MNILLTGASGFIGRPLCDVLMASGNRVRAAVRSASAITSAHETAVVGDINSRTEWGPALAGIDAVIHAAARVHVMRDQASSAKLYAETNELGTRCLATAAANVGVRRFIFLSSVKVNGEAASSIPFTAEDAPRPLDDYAVSKWRGEQHLLEVAAATRMQAAVVRPPLVYGARVGANFRRLIHWVHRGVPLPLGAVRNRRSLVNVWNLCDLLNHLLQVPLSRSIWMVSDGEDLSTPDLITRLGIALHRRARLIAVPVPALRLLGRLTGRAGEMDRLCGSLVVDITRTRSELGWTPPVNVDDALARTAAWYLSGAPADG